MSAAPELRFLFDQHVNGRALRILQQNGVQAVHVAEVGLADADDARVLQWAAAENRIVVTRNHRDFAPLVDAFTRRGMPFAGVLFYSSAIRESDVGAHVRALEAWIEAARAAGANPAESTYGWLTAQ